MKKSAKKYLLEVCEKYNIEVPQKMGCIKIQQYMEDKLKEKGLSDYEIRQEFSSDFEYLCV
jgi:hypothetical protein